MSNDARAPARLFFALWPDPTTRRRLAQVAREHSEQPVASENLHMTLHFLGACTPEQIRCFSQVVSEIEFESFEMKLDYVDFWARPRVRWLGVSRPPAALLDLHRSLGASLVKCGYQADDRDFVAHVTLSRKDRNPGREILRPGVLWSVSELVLAQSVGSAAGVRYRVRERWSAAA